MLQRIHFDDRESWLVGRTAGIGASSAAAAIGMSKWQTNVELWELVTEKRGGKNTNNSHIDFGQKAEEPIRELFKLKHPEMQITYRPYDILYQDDMPWLRATLDGEIVTDTPKRYGAKNGVLEVKTATLSTKAQWEEWDSRVPQQYYIQCLHQLKATGWDFVYLYALLMGQQRWELREYYIDRDDVSGDIDWLVDKEKAFWGYVERKEKPPLILNF